MKNRPTKENRIIQHDTRAADAKPKEGLPRPDLHKALNLVMRLMAIEGKSGEEGRVARYIENQLTRAGVPDSWIKTDAAHTRTPIRGDTGNLVLKLPGTYRGPRRLLMAHMDTVPICVGSQPVRDGDIVTAADQNTGLGADDRAGAAVVLHTALEILRNQYPHPPLTFFWTIQEELGLHGVRHARLDLLSKPRLAFNFDGGEVEKLTVGATSGYRMRIDVFGLASHAGGAPDQGISAISIASLAIADLVRGGWHGAIQKGSHTGTSNFGTIQGGDATNVVTDRVTIRAEARSHEPTFRDRIVRAIEQSFRKAAQEVESRAGRRGRIEIDGQLDYEAFTLPNDEGSVVTAEAALHAIGRTPHHAITNGGLDANWMVARGIPTVTLGCGQVHQHTTREALDLAAFQNACRVALCLATATEK